MANTKKNLTLANKLLKRKKRVRKKVEGSEARPRLSVFRSAKHIYAQVINDELGQTLVSISSFEKGKHASANVEACKDLGKTLADRCKAKNIAAVVFDRNGCRYHGRVKAFAEAVREGGLNF